MLKCSNVNCENPAERFYNIGRLQFQYCYLHFKPIDNVLFKMMNFEKAKRLKQ
jgi:hypothetical protein